MADRDGHDQPRRTAAIRTVRTLVIAAAGAGAATAFGLPAAILVGACLAVAGAAIAGTATAVAGPVRHAAFAVIGTSIGSGIDAGTLAGAGAWPLSLAVMALCLATIMAVNAGYLRRIAGLDAPTALLSTVPGALSYVLALSAAGHGDPRQVALNQSLRLLALTTALPLILGLAVAPVDPGNGTAPGAAPAAITPFPALAILIVLCVVAGSALNRVHVPAGYLLGGMAVSLALHVSGLVTGRPPVWLLAPGFVVTGAVIGARFSGVGAGELARGLRTGLVTVLIALVISALVAQAGATLLDRPFGQMWVAYAPGGIEAMAAMALALGYDPAFIAAHHILRILALSVIVPVLLGRIGRGPRAGPGR